MEFAFAFFIGIIVGFICAAVAKTKMEFVEGYLWAIAVILFIFCAIVHDISHEKNDNQLELEKEKTKQLEIQFQHNPEKPH